MKMRMEFHQIQTIGKKTEIIQKSQIEILDLESIREKKNSLEQPNIRFSLAKQSVTLKAETGLS